MENMFNRDLSRCIDISCVKANHTLAEIDAMIESAIKYQFVCVFALPSFTKYIADKLKEETAVNIGGTVGFPTGADTTASKVFQAKELLSFGADELDMVINITQMKSHNFDVVYHDIKAVVDIAGGRPVKSIIETAYLTVDEIRKASEIAEKAGVSFIKTGTGWSGQPTTVEHIRTIKEVVQNRVKIKAAGGIRSLDTLVQMKNAGCDRFGIGVSSALKIMEEAGQK
ncbi:deoxyribose-phosphate aldolase [Anaerosacchariphilus polymeriproducens]|uniref:Deoxyribose-phosphate aldolase n=1 Tax=Anaerosacchariphilus polymeriproducens TaxID=1812858 RepID=A0A371AYZ4_9FIRM|nr:deoxyribose-phosphate aldolase [Anaerosacchariphilus polymeriproducens]RDU24700.1 deoxyribose-phosphate aldolase [Anaerosacchariphilus polymeriproducens]